MNADGGGPIDGGRKGIPFVGQSPESEITKGRAPLLTLHSEEAISVAITSPQTMHTALKRKGKKLSKDRIVHKALSFYHRKKLLFSFLSDKFKKCSGF